MADVTTIGVGIDGRGAKKGAEVVKGAFRDIKREGKKVRGAIKAVDEAIFSLKGAFAGLSAIAATRALVNVEKNTQAITRGLETVTGSMAGAAAEMAFLADTADDLGLNLGAVEKAYVGLAAAGKGTALQGKATRDIFLGVSKASAVLGLSAEQTGGALTAIQQIISKGKLSAEELRQQLGERLPGAFQIAARSMGVTTEALDKMLSNGEIMSDDFIPKFARQLEEEFGGAAVKAAQGITASFNRLDNAVLELGRTISGSGILDPLIDSAIELTRVLSNQDFLDATAVAAQALGDTILFVGSNVDHLVKAIIAYQALKFARTLDLGGLASRNFAAEFVTLTTGIRAGSAAMEALSFRTKAQIALTRALTFSMRALKAALPFGAVLLAVEALTAWAFSADEAGQSAEELSAKVARLAQNYKELAGAQLQEAILDVQNQIRNLKDADKAIQETLNEADERSQYSIGSEFQKAQEDMIRAFAERERTAKELADAEKLLSNLESQAAGNTEDLAKARNAAAAAARNQETAEAALAKVQGDARETVQGMIASLNEQIATHGKGATETIRYKVANGELAEQLRALGPEGQAYADVLVQLTQQLENLGPASSRASGSLSDAAREMQNAKERADDLLGSLQQEVDLFGRTAAQVDLYRVSVGDLASTFNQLPNGAEMADRYLKLQAELRKATEEQDRFTEAQQAWTQLMQDTATPVDELTAQLGKLYEVEALLTEQADALGLSQEDIALAFGKASDKIQDSYDKIEEDAQKNSDQMSQYAIQAARSIQGAFSDLFFDVMQGNFDGLEDRFKATIDRMVADLVSSQLLDFVGQQFGIGGLGGGVGTTGAGGGSGGGTFDLSSLFSGIGSFFAPGGSAVGNSFTVPGSGGHDSTMMLAPVTPGESVRITTPAQEEMARRDGNNRVGDSAPVSVNMTINTPDAGSFMASRGQIENGVLEMVQRGRRNS